MYKTLMAIMALGILYFSYSSYTEVKSLHADVAKLQTEVRNLKVRSSGKTPVEKPVTLDSLTKQGIDKLRDAEKTIDGLREQIHRLTAQN